MVAIFTGLGAGFERGSGSILGASGLLGSAAMGRGGERLYLNAANGNLMISQQDEFLTGLGPDVSLARTYNSNGDLSDDNGDNWRFASERKILNYAAGTSVQRMSADGSVITYSWDSSKSAYVATGGSGAYDTLTYDGTSWTFTDGDSQVTETYSTSAGAPGSSWRLIRQADTDGNALTFSYIAGTDKLDKVTNADGDWIQYEWSGNNVADLKTGYIELTTGASKTLTRISYTYETFAGSKSRLKTVTVDLTPETAADNQIYTTTYSYRDTSTAMVSRIAQSDGSQIDITYDGSGRVTSIAETVSSGTTRTSSLSYGSGFTAITDALGQATVLSYDGAGNLTSSATYTNRIYNSQFQGANGWAVDYNPNSIAGSPSSGSWMGKNLINLTANATAAGQVFSLGTDSAHWVNVAAGETLFIQAGIEANAVVGSTQATVWFIDANGQTVGSYVVPSTPGALNYNTKVSGFTTVPQGAVRARLELYGTTAGAGSAYISIVEPIIGVALQKTQYAYDTSGNVTGITDPLGNVTTYGDFANGLARRITDPLGNVTKRTYGAKNELLTETHWNRSSSADVANDDFEAPDQGSGYLYSPSIAGMSNSGGAVLVGNNSAWGFAAAPDGDQVAVMQGTASFSQTLSGLSAGTEYAVAFKLAPRPSTGGTPVTVKVDGVSIGTFMPESNNFQEFVAYFTAGSTTANLSFSTSATADVSTALDSVTVVGPSTTHFAYDGEDHLRFSVTTEGRVTEYRYDAAGNVRSTIEYAGTTGTAGTSGQTSSALANGPRYSGTAFDTASLEKWVASLNPSVQVKRTDQAYDPRGNLLTSTSFTELAVNRLYNPEFNGATGWQIGYNPSGIVTTGSPYSGWWGGKSLLKADINATAAGQDFSIATDWNQNVDVQAGETLYAEVGVQTGGTASNALLVVQWFNASGAALGGSWVGVPANNPTDFDHKLSGYVEVPASAVRARLEVYSKSSAAGTGFLSIVNPILETAAAYPDQGINRVVDPRFDSAAGTWTSYNQQSGAIVGGAPGVGVDSTTGLPYLALTFNNSSTNSLVNMASPNKISVAGNEWLNVSAAIGATAGVGNIQLNMQFLDASGATIIEKNVYTANGAQSFPARIGGYVQAPSNAVSAFLLINAWSATPNTNQTLILSDPRVVASPDSEINRVQDSRFEHGTAGWSMYDSTSGQNLVGGLTVGIDGATGKRYLQQSFHASASSNMVAFTDNNFTAVEGGERLAVRAGLGATSGVSQVYLGIQFFDENGNYLSEVSLGTRAGGQAFNTPLSGFVNAPANARSARLVADFWAGAQGTTETITITEPYIAKAGLWQGSTGASTPGVSPLANPVGNLWSASYQRTGFVYDQAGKLLSRQVDGRNAETFLYDGLGRLKSAVDVNGGTTTYFFDDAATTTVVTNLATGRVQTSVYAKSGELLNFTETGTATNPSPEVGTAQYRYDRLGQLRWESDETGVKTYHFYDVGGRKTADVSSAGDITEYRYDADNRIVATVKRGNRLSIAQVSALDDLNAPADFDAVRPAGEDHDLWSFIVYDKKGRIAQTIDGAGRTAVNNYDSQGRLVSTIQYGNTLDPQTVANLKTGVASGPELIGNGDGNGLAGWNAVHATLSLSNGTLVITSDNSGNVDYAYQAINGLEVGKSYQLKGFYGPSNGVSYASYGIGTTPGASGGIGGYPGGGGGTINFTATATTMYVTLRAGTNGNGWQVSFDNLSLKLLTPQPLSQVMLPAADPARDSVSRNFYDKDGLLVGELDGEGYLREYKYDNAGQKIEDRAYATATSVAARAAGSLASLRPATTADDRVTYYSYDGAGQLRFTTDALNYVTQIDYDQAGQATSVTRYAAPIQASADHSYANVRTLLLNWNVPANGANRTSWTVYDSAGRAAYTIGAEGAVTAYTYNSAGQVTKQVEFAATRPTSTLPSKRTMDDWKAQGSIAGDAGNRTTRYYYDGAGALRYTVDAEGYVSRQTVDAEGRSKSVSRYANRINVGDGDTLTSVTALVAANGGTAITTTSSYDYMGRLSTSTDGEGNQTSYDYIANGKLAQVTVAAGTSDASTTLYQYDYAGRLVHEYHALGAAEQTHTQYGYDGLGNLVSVIDPRSILTLHYYDRAGNRVMTVEDANAIRKVTEWSYNGFGEVTSDNAHYSMLGYTPSVTVKPSISSNSWDEVTSFIYDARGEVTKVTDANNVATNSSYNAFGELSQTFHGFATTYYFYDRAGRQTDVQDALNYHTLSAYDTFGNLISVTRGSAVTKFAYDRLGRLIKSTDAQGYYESYGYDAYGNRITVRNKLGGTIVNTYDKRGLLLSETLPMESVKADGTIQARSVTNSFLYDRRGNRTRMIEADGLTEHRTTLYEYDKLDRLTRKKGDAVSTLNADHIGLTGGVVPTEVYTYDLGGNLIMVTDANNKQTFSYFDGLGRKTAEVNAVGILTVWTYDAFNKRSETIYLDPVAIPGSPGGSPPAHTAASLATTNYGYDRLNRLTSTSVDNATVASWSGSGITTSSQTVTSWISYDINGNVTGTIDENGNSTSAWYDWLGRKTDARDQENYLTHWTYDAEGNVLSETRYATQYVPGNVITANPPTVGSSSNDRVTTFTYDKNGNRLTETRLNVEAWANNEANRNLVNVTGSATITYTYNGLGQVTTKREATGDTTTYGYDKTGRLILEEDPVYVDLSGSKVQKYITNSYDGLNNLTRTQQVASSTLVSNVGGGWQVVGSGDINGDGIGDLILRYTDGQISTWLGRADGSWIGVQSWPAIGNDWHISGFADFNGDGRIDILWRNDNGTVKDWLGNTDGTFSDNWQNSTNGVGNDWHIVGTGDFDGDGLAGILWRNDNGTLVTWEARSNGGNWVSTYGNTVSTDWKVAGTGDYNGDGRADILWRNDSGMMTSWLAQGVNNFVGSGLSVNPGANWHVVGTGDFNGDGRADALFRADDGTVTDWLGQADGSFYHNWANVAQAGPSGYNAVGVSDINGDGRADIIWGNAAGFQKWTGQAAGDFTAQGNNEANRVTQYIYGAGGRLSQMQDAAGAWTDYYYDAAGNLMRQSWTRGLANGSSTVVEGHLFDRDALGRVTSEYLAQWNGSTWLTGDHQNTTYTAFGAVAQRGINGLQEQFVYNNRGQLEKSNTGDGVWRFYAYDKAGNQLLMVEDEGYGTTLSDKSLAQVMSYLGGNAGASFVDGLNATAYFYDKRGQLSQARQMKRETNLIGSNLNDVVTSQGYNAFGEVSYQTDARNNTSWFYYNTMGKLTWKVLPQVAYTNENGVVANATPSYYTYNDLSGRVIGQQDANGVVQSRMLLAGTGYGGSEALVRKEFHSDGGIVENKYDVFGDQRTIINENGYVEYKTYDAMSRMVSYQHRGGFLTDYYSYDLLGQRIAHWNSQLGSGNKELTDYDLQGRVTSQRAFGGDTTITAYEWDPNVANSNMNCFGSIKQTVTMANGKTSIGWTDTFGHILQRKDLGDHYTYYGYDSAGRQVSRSTSGETQTTAYYNSGLAQSTSLGGNDYSTYTYDANGNKLREVTVRAGDMVQNATVTYDALNRMVTWDEPVLTNIPVASKQLEYDLNGNVRRDRSYIAYLDGQGNASTANMLTQDEYYKYDSMGRVVLSDAVMVNGAMANSQGVVQTAHILYDAAGRRVSVDRVVTDQGMAANPDYVPDRPGEPGWGAPYNWIDYEHHTREDYFYNTDDTLTSIRVAQTTYTDNGQGGITVTPAPATGALKSYFWYDAMGHQTRQIDYLGDGTNTAFDHQTVYDTNGSGRILNEYTYTKHLVSGTTYDYYNETVTNTYANGVISQTDDSVSKNGGAAVTNRTNNYYAWYDGAVLSSMTYKPDVSQSTTFTTTYYLSPSGILTSAYIGDAHARSVTYVNDMNGQVIYRDENDSLAAGDPKAVFYRFDGKEISTASNQQQQNIDSELSSINDRTQPVPPAFNASTYGFGGNGWPDGDLSFQSINSFQQGSVTGTYVVQGGETLQSIAQTAFGDSSYWYKIAEANGLSSNSMLVAGQSLVLPGGVVRSHNSAGTFTPYDSSFAAGTTSPTTQAAIKPPKHNKCGVFGVILLVAIAVAVTVVTSGALAAASISAAGGGSVGLGAGISAAFGGTVAAGAGATVAGSFALTGVGLAAVGAAGAAVGSIVSQGFGVATGLQDKFSWKGVAMSAISGGIGGGLGKLIPGAGFVAGATRGVLGSAVSQGLAVATGVQNKFDWVGVAAAGVSGGLSSVLADKFHVQGLGVNNSLANHVAGAGVGMAGAIANAATRSLLQGSDFGDNLMASLPDILGQTIGNMVAYGVSERAAGLPARSKIQGGFDGVDKGIQLAALDWKAAVAGKLNDLWDGAVRLSNDGRNFLDSYFDAHGWDRPITVIGTKLDRAFDSAERYLNSILDYNLVHSFATPVSRRLDQAGWHATAAGIRSYDAGWTHLTHAGVQDVIGIGRAIAHPITTAEGVFNLAMHPSVVVSAAETKVRAFIASDNLTRSGMVGSLIGHIGTALLTADASLTRAGSMARGAAADRMAINAAKANQLKWGYAADDWGISKLSAGDRVFGGLPGPSAYYTDAETLAASGGSRTALFESLQVEPHHEFGYRPVMGEYEVLADIRVPFGTARANANFGAGGGNQFFIENYADRLRLVREHPLGQ